MSEEASAHFEPALARATALNAIAALRPKPPARYSVVVTVKDMPSISVPAGFTTNGLPLDFQLIGPRERDVELIAPAEAAAMVFAGEGEKPFGSGRCLCFVARCEHSFLPPDIWKTALSQTHLTRSRRSWPLRSWG
jgi:hypothetical protein